MMQTVQCLTCPGLLKSRPRALGTWWLCTRSDACFGCPCPAGSFTIWSFVQLAPAADELQTPVYRKCGSPNRGSSQLPPTDQPTRGPLPPLTTHYSASASGRTNRTSHPHHLVALCNARCCAGVNLWTGPWKAMGSSMSVSP